VIGGIVFDLDGTLVDSRLDFEAMRAEMALPPGLPILEGLGRLPAEEAERCRAILDRHERAGAERATLLPGVGELRAALAERGIRQALATRNSRQITDATLRKLQLPFEIALTRDDGPVKPDPWPVLYVCRRWRLPPGEVVVIGDFRFDIECGRAAGCRTVLLTHAPDPARYPNPEQADLVLTSLAEFPRLLAWLETQ
jgi:HAD superfamily hydrolase (TIGR01549 family)